MLREEVVHVCPIGISESCERFESLNDPFTHHHINGDSARSEFWNLIRLCKSCHDVIHNIHSNNKKVQRQIRLRKRLLTLQWLGPLAVNVLVLAKRFQVTSAMPCAVIRLLEYGYLEIANSNTLTIGSSPHATLQDYRITKRGVELVEHLFRRSTVDDRLLR